MTRAIGLLGLVGLLEIAAAGTASGLNEGLTFDVDGQARTYDLLVPPVSGDAALVVDLHPLTGTSTGQRQRSGWQALAQQEGFIVAWPQAPGNSWADGVGNPLNRDDTSLIRALVADVAGRVAIDTTRIYATGFSNGGSMTHKLACEASDLFAAYASFAGGLADDTIEADCAAVRPLPILTVRGDSDQQVPFLGGNLFGGTGPPVKSAQSTYEFWRTLGGCGSGLSDSRTDLGAASFCDFDTSCQGDVEVGFCTTRSSEADGHNLYNNVDDVDWAPEAWEFMKRFTLVDNGFEINAGLNGAWYDPAIPGQGFLLDVIADSGVIFLAWFTFEAGGTAKVGATDQRWLTAQGAYQGAVAMDLPVTRTSGGFFASDQAVTQEQVGTISLEFSSCTELRLIYDLIDAGLAGTIDLIRLTPDIFCESEAAIKRYEASAEPPSE